VEKREFVVRVVGRSVLVVILGLGLLGVVPARAAVSTLDPPTWSAPVDLDRPNEVGAPAAVGMDAAGNATAVWWASTGGPQQVLRSATRPAGGAWSAPVNRGAPAETDSTFEFAEDGTGRAIMAWSQWNGSHFALVAAVVEADGTWEPTTAVSPPGESGGEVGVTIDESGHALVIWRGDAGIEAATYTYGSSWSPVETLSTSSEAAAPQVSSNATGDVTATWWLQYTHVAFAVSRPFGGSWGPVTTLSSTGVEADVPLVAEGPDGSARAVWSELQSGTWNLVGADRSPVGDWSTPASTGAPPGAGASALHTDAAGESLMVLRGADPEGAVFSQTRPAVGPWNAVLEAVPSGLGIETVAVAIDPGDDALLAVNIRDDSGFATWTTLLPHGGVWSPMQRVQGTSEWAYGERVALDAAGDAVLLWSAAGSIPSKVQALTSPTASAPVVLVPMFTG
jgi:hypothetical protein